MLPEGAGKQNLVDLQDNSRDFTIRFGHMIEYTDEVELFSEDIIQKRYREELGYYANEIFEDAVQRDMLSTNNVLYSGLELV